MWHFINNNGNRTTLNDALHIKLLVSMPINYYFKARNEFNALYKRFSILAPMGINPSNNNIKAFFSLFTGFSKHGIGLANSRGSA